MNDGTDAVQERERRIFPELHERVQWGDAYFGGGGADLWSYGERMDGVLLFGPDHLRVHADGDGKDPWTYPAGQIIVPRSAWPRIVAILTAALAAPTLEERDG